MRECGANGKLRVNDKLTMGKHIVWFYVTSSSILKRNFENP